MSYPLRIGVIQSRAIIHRCKLTQTMLFVATSEPSRIHEIVWGDSGVMIPLTLWRLLAAPHVDTGETGDTIESPGTAPCSWAVDDRNNRSR